MGFKSFHQKKHLSSLFSMNFLMYCQRFSLFHSFSKYSLNVSHMSSTTLDTVEVTVNKAKSSLLLWVYAPDEVLAKVGALVSNLLMENMKLKKPRCWLGRFCGQWVGSAFTVTYCLPMLETSGTHGHAIHTLVGPDGIIPLLKSRHWPTGRGHSTYVCMKTQEWGWGMEGTGDEFVASLQEPSSQFV